MQGTFAPYTESESLSGHSWDGEQQGVAVEIGQNDEHLGQRKEGFEAAGAVYECARAHVCACVCACALTGRHCGKPVTSWVGSVRRGCPDEQGHS